MSTYLAEHSPDHSDWITQAEAARLRKVTRQAISKLIGAGRLETFEIGGRIFVRRSAVMAFEPLPAGRRKNNKHHG